MVIVGSMVHVQGIITDGDLRRSLLRHPDTATLTVEEMMTANPVIVDGEAFLSKAEHLMMEKKITTILVGSPLNRSLMGIYQIYNG
jgi:arabinose-5-phosphate isomerase